MSAAEPGEKLELLERAIALELCAASRNSLVCPFCGSSGPCQSWDMAVTFMREAKAVMRLLTRLDPLG